MLIKSIQIKYPVKIGGKYRSEQDILESGDAMKIEIGADFKGVGVRLDKDPIIHFIPIEMIKLIDFYPPAVAPVANPAKLIQADVDAGKLSIEPPAVVTIPKTQPAAKAAEPAKAWLPKKPGRPRK